jgi:hypothetical protein
MENQKEPPALVRNAADPEQVREAGKKERFVKRNELDDIRIVLSTPNGRRCLWKILEESHVFESVWHPSALIHYRSGAQDVGLILRNKIIEANLEAYLTMERENLKEKENG